MFTFHSMTHVTILITITLLFLLLFALKNNPLFPAGAFVQELFVSPKFLLHFIAVIGMLFFNKLELWVESKMQHHADFTPVFYKLEGNFVASLQHLLSNPALTYVSSFFYVVVFPCLMVASIGIYTYQKKNRLFYALCYALLINYMIATPFYLFFSVNEVWSFLPNVKFMLKDVFPTFEADYRPLSGLDNCFPSLHTALSISIAVVARKSGNAFWKKFTLLSAVFIIFSIFYLGIHWLTDMAAGILLGVVAAQAGLRISEARMVDVVLGRQLYKPLKFREKT